MWLSPSFPSGFERLRVEGVQVGGTTLSVTVEAGGVEVRCDGGLRVIAERRGPLTEIIDSEASAG